MKTLYLLRHAKSDHSDGSLRDHERPLAPRGRRAAPAMAEYMAREALDPEVVLCSTATRTRQTWEGMDGRLGHEATVIFDPDLYGASPHAILKAVGRVPDDVTRVLVIGHNPGLEELAVGLVTEGRRSDRDRMAVKYPTGALAVLRSDAGRWDDIGQTACELERFVRPKDLPEAEELRL